MKCDNTLGIMYLLVFMLVLILTGVTIKEGKSERKMISWTLYSFSLLFGLVVFLIFFADCNDDTKKKAKKIVIPLLTVILCISNMIGMVISEPDLQTSQLFIPHLVNIILLIGSIFVGFGVCGNSIVNSDSKQEQES